MAVGPRDRSETKEDDKLAQSVEELFSLPEGDDDPEEDEDSCETEDSEEDQEY